MTNKYVEYAELIKKFDELSAKNPEPNSKEFKELKQLAETINLYEETGEF